MTPVSIASVAASLAGLVLSIWLFGASHSAQGLQKELQDQQQELQNKQTVVQTQQQRLQAQQDQINTGNTLINQVGPQVLQSMGTAVVNNKNEKLRGLLKKYGVDVSDKKDAPAGGAASTPKPAAPAPATTPAP